MMEEYKTYEVKLKTARPDVSAFVLRDAENIMAHWPCTDGKIIVLTKEPAKIFEVFKDLIISITRKPTGYLI